MKIDGGEPVSTYVYALTHNSASLLPKGIDWLPLSPTPLSQNHIRYHEVQLKGGNSDLRDTLAQGEYPTAVVLVNIDNTNDLSVAITIDRIPTIVVTASVGKLLRDVLYDSSKKTVLCKIYPIAPMAAELDVSPQQCKCTFPFVHSNVLCIYELLWVFSSAPYIIKMHSVSSVLPHHASMLIYYGCYGKTEAEETLRLFFTV